MMITGGGCHARPSFKSAMIRTDMIDWISIKLSGLGIILGIFTAATKSEILFWATLLSCASTIAYNAWKWHKNK